MKGFESSDISEKNMLSSYLLLSVCNVLVFYISHLDRLQKQRQRYESRRVDFRGPSGDEFWILAGPFLWIYLHFIDIQRLNIIIIIIANYILCYTFSNASKESRKQGIWFKRNKTLRATTAGIHKIFQEQKLCKYYAKYTSL